MTSRGDKALSPQEFYLAQQLRDGRSYEEIADKLYVSRRDHPARRF